MSRELAELQVRSERVFSAARECLADLDNDQLAHMAAKWTGAVELVPNDEARTMLVCAASFVVNELTRRAEDEEHGR